MSRPTEPPESYPLPWSADGGRPNTGLRSSNGKFLVSVYPDDRYGGPEIADYIVTAANGYPVLLEAVREVIADLLIVGPASITQQEVFDSNLNGAIKGANAAARLQDALDKIGGES